MVAAPRRRVRGTAGSAPRRGAADGRTPPLLAAQRREDPRRRAAHRGRHREGRGWAEPLGRTAGPRDGLRRQHPRRPGGRGAAARVRLAARLGALRRRHLPGALDLDHPGGSRQRTGAARADPLPALPALRHARDLARKEDPALVPRGHGDRDGGPGPPLPEPGRQRAVAAAEPELDAFRDGEILSVDQSTEMYGLALHAFTFLERRYGPQRLEGLMATMRERLRLRDRLREVDRRAHRPVPARLRELPPPAGLSRRGPQAAPPAPRREAADAEAQRSATGPAGHGMKMPACAVVVT